MTSRSFKIITLGCKVNQCESAYLKESLQSAGLREASKDESADIAVVNTCIVTQKASYQSRQAIRKAVKENPSGVVAAIGCYAQVFPEELSQISEVNLIAGNTVKRELPDILMGGMDAGRPCLISEEFTPDKTFDRLPIKGFLGRARAFLKIQDGCQSYCSYCIVPFARGPLRSLDPPEVIVMLESLWNEGYREVVLTGVHLGKYGVDLNNGMDLKGLLHVIGTEALSARIRLSSIEPNEIDRELIEMMASENWLCPHLHIPLQSADDEILKKMNRHYTAQEFRRLIERIHNRIPIAAIGVDVMVGFPGEDDRAYQNTFSLIKDLPVSYLHVFPYSPRKGTAAAGFSDQIDQKVIKERAAELRSLGQEKRDAFHRSCRGKDFSVLAEGWESEEKKIMKGTSDNYLPVIFHSPQDCRGQLVPVRMVKLETGKVIGMASTRSSNTNQRVTV
jgi:threonylcarbamoyladenosine tRNA methylthiotransferase MtaB